MVKKSTILYGLYSWHIFVRIHDFPRRITIKLDNH